MGNASFDARLQNEEGGGGSGNWEQVSGGVEEAQRGNTNLAHQKKEPGCFFIRRHAANSRFDDRKKTIIFARRGRRSPAFPTSDRRRKRSGLFEWNAD